MSLKDFKDISNEIKELLKAYIKPSQAPSSSIKDIYKEIKDNLDSLNKLIRINKILNFTHINSIIFTKITNETNQIKITAITALNEKQIIIGTTKGKLYIYDLNYVINVPRSSFDSKTHHKTEISIIKAYENYFISKCQKKLIIWKIKTVNGKMQVKTKKEYKNPQELIDVIWKDGSHLYLCHARGITLMNIKQGYDTKKYQLSQEITSFLLLDASDDTFITSCKTPNCLLRFNSKEKKLNNYLYTSFRNGLVKSENNIIVAFKDDCSFKIIDEFLNIIKEINVSNFNVFSSLVGSNLFYFVFEGTSHNHIINVENSERNENLNQNNISEELELSFNKRYNLIVYNYELKYLGIVEKTPINN